VITCTDTPMPYTLVDHTADLALRVSAPTPGDLFAEAALALCDVMGALLAFREETLRVEVTGIDREDLLVRWLQEVLYHVQVRGFRVCGAGPVDLEEGSASGALDGAHVGGALLAEIKAVTYHGLAVERVGGAYEATIILDV